MIPTTCRICQDSFEPNDRVIFSATQEFVFKPAHMNDEPIVQRDKDGKKIKVSPAAVLSPDQLREARKDYLKTAVVNVFVDWGKADIPQDAFNFRHQWCEPHRTATIGSLHPVSKHSIRFGRGMAKRLNG